MKADEYMGKLEQILSALRDREMDKLARQEMTAALFMLTACFRRGISGMEWERLIFEIGVLQARFGVVALPKDEVGSILGFTSVNTLLRGVVEYLRTYPPRRA